jgi:hypothetical protein
MTTLDVFNAVLSWILHIAAIPLALAGFGYMALALILPFRPTKR